MKKTSYIFSLIILILLSCSESDDNPHEESLCDEITIVDHDRYNNTESKGFLIKSVELTGDCLEVKIESAGCDSDSWEVDLIDSSGIAESLPVQRFLRISLDNTGDCLAMVIKTYTFDLRPIRTGDDVVLLNLALWEELIPYEY